MCGIAFIICENMCSACTSNESRALILQKRLRSPLLSRGPDGHNSIYLPSPETNHKDETYDSLFCGSVLHIQGDSPALQPYCDESGNILLWNGEVFSTSDVDVALGSILEIRQGESDTASVCRYLSSVCESSLEFYGTQQTSNAMAWALSSICGPYCFVFFHKESNGLHFGRDPFGRRSLLLHSTQSLMRCVQMGDDLVEFTLGVDDVFALSSVAPASASAEKNSGVSHLEPSEEQMQSPSKDLSGEGNWEEIGIDGIYSLFVKASPKRYILTHTKWPENRIKLYRSIALQEMSNSESVLPLAKSVRDARIDVGAPAHIFMKTLLSAVHRRVSSMVGQAGPLNLNSLLENCAKKPLDLAGMADLSILSTLAAPAQSGRFSSECRPSSAAAAAGKIGVLFSGGIDSVLLTALLHHTVHPSLPIDLLNVTFIKTPAGGGGSGAHLTKAASPSPDRVAAIAALLELQALFPEREWRLVHIDVGEEERFAHEQHIKDLIYPRDTHMDLNIGTAFWFASRGKGYLRSYSSSQLRELFAASASDGSAAGGGDLDDEAEGGATDIRICKKGTTRSGNDNSRSLLRHGGQCSAESSSARGGAGTPSPRPPPPPPKLVELAPGKFKCLLESCNRVCKMGCERFLCKKCCDAAHRQKALGVDSPEEVSQYLFRGGLQCSEEELLNTCPAHRTKQKQLNKLQSKNIAAQTSSLQQQVQQQHQAEPLPPEDTLNPADLSESSPQDLRNVAASEEVSSDAAKAEGAVPAAKDLSVLTPAAEEEEMAETAEKEAAIKKEEKKEEVHCVPYESRCKALLVGIGADEQMAGYGRHRSVFMRAFNDAAHGLASTSAGESLSTTVSALSMDATKEASTSSATAAAANLMNHRLCAQAGAAALEDELNKDLTRLWKRNLGRDDRCISDNGKEAWFPFLDEEVVRLLQSLPIDQIADMSQSQGVGDKMILRGAAKLLGLNQCTGLVKRAIQFGTRVAQHTNQHYHSSNRKAKGDAKI